MEKNDQIIFSEVYEALNILGKEYIEKIPKQLYEFIEKNKAEDYKVKFNYIEDFVTPNVNKKSISMIALFHLKYWCENDKEKNEILKILNENKIKKEERYKYNDLFANKKNG